MSEATTTYTVIYEVTGDHEKHNEWWRMISLVEHSVTETRRNWPPGVAELETILGKLKEMARGQ